MIKLNLFLIAILTSPIVAADWSEVGKLNNVRVTSGEYIYGSLVGANLPCGGGSSFKVKSDLRLESGILSILITGQTSGVDVSILFDPSDECLGGYGQFTQVSGAKLVK